MSATGKVQGEGNYEAAEEYNESQQKFVKSGKVKDAARDAEPASAEEAEELEDAEEAGRSHSKGEDATDGMKDEPGDDRPQ